jgi:hypothetical protein
MLPRLAILTIIVGFLAELNPPHLAWCASQAADEANKGALEIPKGPPSAPQGIPALRAKVGAGGPFTREDAEAYFRTHNLLRNMTSTASFKVDKLEFLTNREVTQRLKGVSPGLGDSEPIGLVTLKGEFKFAGPPGTTPAEFTHAYAAFDAKTGNLLVTGTMQ